MTMERLVLPVLALLAVVLQTTVIPQLAIGVIAPDLIFLLVLFLALRRQTTLSLWLAFGAGLLQDFTGGGAPGLNAILLLGLVYLALYLRQKFFQENFLSLVLIIIFFTWLHEFLSYFVLNTLLHAGFNFTHWLVRAAGMSLYHALLGPLLFRGLRQLFPQDDLGWKVNKRQGVCRGGF